MTGASNEQAVSLSQEPPAAPPSKSGGNPKQDRAQLSIFPYYAGFSAGFVENTLAKYVESGPVLDPWNGAGTTTAVCSDSGIASAGVDINPLMVLVGRARILDQKVWAAVKEILPDNWDEDNDRVDILERWLKPGSARIIRGFERAIWESLGGVLGTFSFDEPETCTSLQAAASIVVATTTRDLLFQFHTSNPTWFRLRVATEDRLTIRRKDVLRRARNISDQLARAARLRAQTTAIVPDIRLGDAANLPFDDLSFGAAITSPPYCTRIDYAIATLPELAAIGLPSQTTLQSLRNKMTGAPSWNSSIVHDHLDNFGSGISTFLSTVLTHSSKASSSYYYPFYLSYFRRYARSLQEIHRTLRANGVVSIVVQDSHYKESPVALRAWTIEQLELLQFKIVHQQVFPVPAPIALNPAGKKYRSSNATTEGVIVARKEPP